MSLVELADGVVRAHPKAIVALEAVSARQTAPRLVQGRRLVEAADDLIKRRGPSGCLEAWPYRFGGVGVIPGVQMCRCGKGVADAMLR